MKTYKLARYSFIVYIIMLPIIYTLIGIWLLSYIIISKNSYPLPIWLFVCWIILLGYIYYKFLNSLVRITITSDNTIEFRSILCKRTALPIEIISISAIAPGFVKIKLSRKSVSLINHFDGFYEFLATVKSLNPNIVIKNLWAD